MDTAFLASGRPGLPLLQKIGHFLDTAASNVYTKPRAHSSPTSFPGGTFSPSLAGGYQREPIYHENEYQHQYEPPYSLPLGLIPEELRLNVLSFLPAKELSSARGVNSEFLRTANRHTDVLWGSLCRSDFPSMEPTVAGLQERVRLSPHQQYVKNVMHRANDEAGNLRANYRLRESLDSFTSRATWSAKIGQANLYSAINDAFGTSFGGSTGVIGILSDLVTVQDPRIARALSHKRRVALSTVVVHDENVLVDFRRSGLYQGPVNFLPYSSLRGDDGVPTPRLLPILPMLIRMSGTAAANSAVAAVSSAAGMRGGAMDGDNSGNREEENNGGDNAHKDDLLPLAPETPAPTGFLGYAVRLFRLRPEHEPLRWTVLFALFVDMVVFETTEQAEAVRARMPDRRLFYCALDHPGAQNDPCALDGQPLPHISHWGFQRLPVGGDGGGGDDKDGRRTGVAGAGWETVGDAVERQERTACLARSSLAFLQYGGGVGQRVLA